jgi:hypothetical protein
MKEDIQAYKLTECLNSLLHGERKDLYIDHKKNSCTVSYDEKTK